MIYYFTILYLFYIRIGGFKDLFSRSPMWEGDYICVLLICFGKMMENGRDIPLQRVSITSGFHF